MGWGLPPRPRCRGLRWPVCSPSVASLGSEHHLRSKIKNPLHTAALLLPLMAT